MKTFLSRKGNRILKFILVALILIFSYFFFISLIDYFIITHSQISLNYSIFYALFLALLIGIIYKN